MTVPFDRMAAIRFWRERSRHEPVSMAERRAYRHLLSIPNLAPGDLMPWQSGVVVLPLYRMRALPAPIRASEAWT